MLHSNAHSADVICFAVIHWVFVLSNPSHTTSGGFLYPEGSYIWPSIVGAENISRPWLLRICQSGDNALNSCICSQILGRRRMEFMIWGESQYGMQIGCFLPEENITFNNSLVFLQQQKIRNAAPATLSRSRIRTWGHTAGRQRGTRWCRSCTSTEKGIIWAN